MTPTTPAQLSLELNIDQKRIRDFLRELYVRATSAGASDNKRQVA